MPVSPDNATMALVGPLKGPQTPEHFSALMTTENYNPGNPCPHTGE